VSPQAIVSGSSVVQGLLVALGTALIGAALAYGIGVQVTERWDERKRRREADLAALAEFYRLYGDFFATWKLWNAHKRFAQTVASPEHAQWSLMQRAADTEGGFEALLVKVVAERKLKPPDIELLGCFREGYQTLRETIRKNKALGWRATEPPGNKPPNPDYNPTDPQTGYRQYRAFKLIAQQFAVQLAEYPKRHTRRVPPSEADARSKILEVTDRTTFKNEWWVLSTARLDTKSPSPHLTDQQAAGHQ
jgi:hypothetical protein